MNLTDWLPIFTQRDLDRWRERGQQDGYMRGFRDGVARAQELDEIRRGKTPLAEGRVVLRIVEDEDTA